jgi:DNA-binding NtrC family response regulator
MDLFAQIRQRWPATEVIILTGFGDLESARAAIRLDVVDFLSKPCHLREIEVALDRARRRLVNALATRDSDKSPDKPGDTPETLEEIERQQILKALERHGGNRTRAAAELGISRRTLHYRLASYGQIRQPADREQRSS